MIQLKAEHTKLASITSDVTAFFVNEDKQTFVHQISILKHTFKGIEEPLEAGVFSGKFQETLTMFPSNKKKIRLVLIGLGKLNAVTLERLRRVAATAAKSANGLKGSSLSIILPDDDTVQQTGYPLDMVAGALSEGAVLSQYKFDKYLTGENKKPSSVKSITFVTDDQKRLAQLKPGVGRAQIICDATILARNLANAPASEIYPITLARHAKEAGRKAKLRVTIFDEKQIRRLKMGGVLGVAKGSDQPPRFIVMEHNAGKKRVPTVVLVGKGVTFDAGGISIKPAAGMGEMKMDMSGAAAVIATMTAVARLNLPLHVVGLVPAVENLLGGSAMKPGDVITHLNGKTSEVDNTDAEGRLILADALSYAARYKPAAVIDLATLTGHVLVALGHYATGMMGNDENLMKRLTKAGERTYERVWQLPMFDEYEKQNKSDIADVKNTGGRPAGAITAAFFLKQFIGDYPWVHLDIAGTATLSESLDYIPRGASGVGVRLLVDALENWSADNTKGRN